MSAAGAGLLMLVLAADALSLPSCAGARGRGSTNCGCFLAVAAMAAYVAAGMAAQRERGSSMWRMRQMASISFGGSARVLGMSRKEERVLRPGGFCGDGGDEDAVCDTGLSD